MVYLVRYQANYECPKGHKFVAEASPFKDDAEVRCMRCFEDWIAANVPLGRQVGKAKVADEPQGFAYTAD